MHPVVLARSLVSDRDLLGFEVIVQLVRTRFRGTTHNAVLFQLFCYCRTKKKAQPACEGLCLHSG
jgi:hypothetical protein